MTRIATHVAGVCIVRDACDLIGLVCGHYLRIGLAHIRIIDDGSTDGTHEFLRYLAGKTPRLSIVRVDDTQFRQAELMSDAANELICQGFQIILPFDVDEFWDVNGPRLEERYAWDREIIFRGHWINFVQTTKATEASMLPAEDEIRCAFYE
jgi:hypothetical protein